jgi:hypothetical protein
MRTRFSYANVAATLALVFSMTGGALAANHYLITSTKQISPKVLKKLKGNAGKTGAPGTSGAAGKEGATGKEGVPGKEGARGPSNGYQAFKNNFGPAVTSATTVGTLAVPAGSYLASAKLSVLNNSSTEEVLVFCKLFNDENGDNDTAEFVVPKKGTEWFGEDAASLQAATTLGAPGHWSVSCEAIGGPSVNVKWIKIHAIQVATLSNTNA